jgi:hypothetical protein
VEFTVNAEGRIVVRKAARPVAGKAVGGPRDRFEAACGKAQVKWRTDDLMTASARRRFLQSPACFALPIRRLGRNRRALRQRRLPCLCLPV